jgi:hypothetical protein
MLLVTTALSGLMAGLIQTAPTPQTPPATHAPVSDETVIDLGTITTAGGRLRGAVNSDIPPDLTLSAEQIQAYGASNISELLDYLEPVTRSSRGRADGQPVMLVNGRRVSGFQEIRSIPTEAIERVDIMPEEVALQYGYSADQRVVNFVLKPSFRSISGQAAVRGPTQGGRTTTDLEASIFSIAGGSRWSLDVEHERSSPLFESERNIVREPGSTPYDLIGNVLGAPFGTETSPGVLVTPVPQTQGAPTLADFLAASGAPRSGDLGAYRTLMAQSEELSLRGSVKHDLNDTTAGTLSIGLKNATSRSFNGLPGVILNLDAANSFSPFADDVQVFRYLDAPDSMGRKTDTLTLNVGTVLDGFLGDWRWTLTSNYDRIETDTITGRGYSVTPFQTRLEANDPVANPFGALTAADFAPMGYDTANSVSQVLGAELVLNGKLYTLPAGGVTSTFKLGADTRSLDSTSLRGGDVIDRSQSRDRVNGTASFDIPVSDRAQDVLPFLGDLSLNVNLGYEELSDFGGLPTLGASVNWSPIEPLSFLLSYTDEQGAPSISQLNDPIITTANVPVFDFATGKTVFVSRIDGGNPGLNADNRHVFKAGVTFRPTMSAGDLRLSSTWTLSRTDDVLAAFPTITPELEAALPGRFERAAPLPGEAVGELLSFDARALNFDRAERQDIRTGFNFSRPFGTPRPAAESEGDGGMRGPGGGRGPRMEGGGGGGPRGPGGGGRGGGNRMQMQPGQGMFNLSIYHTWRLQDEIVIRDGLPVIDLLDGGATGSRGGSPRHEIQVQAGVFKDGMGAFMNANWRDSTRVNGGSTGADLLFADQTTINLNMFVDLGARTSLVERWSWLKGSRLNLGVQNILDSRPEVRASNSDLPLNYQPDYLDPQGRTISLTFRKILF